MVCEILDALCFDIVVTLFGSTVAVIIPLLSLFENMLFNFFDEFILVRASGASGESAEGRHRTA